MLLRFHVPLMTNCRERQGKSIACRNPFGIGERQETNPLGYSQIEDGRKGILLGGP